ncbi:hypothetical protein K457DRAFT_27057 [Linnemannia elongata AG-77]|uniref:Uncharacterized protein n=1 Tax=Linnemannia elongata AG-77 TaxID=1314771 RepID=A0A197KE72_9FUNG|nr:hypothetical protein K457DRAFT_27057 [Linnemannia elongata AG-77]
MTKGNPSNKATTTTPAATDTDMAPSTTFTSSTPPNSTQATASTTSHAQQTHTRSSSNSSTYGSTHGTTEIGGMSITLPFSSFTSGPSELAQHMVTSLASPSNMTQSSQGLSTDPGTDNIATSSGAQPMAIKPVYKKRVYPSTQRPDGIIKKTGVAAAGEKTQARQAIENAAKSRGNIYDRTTGTTHSRAPPTTPAASSPSPHAAEPLESSAKKERLQKQKKVKIIKPRKQPIPKPPKKPKVVKPPRIWTPHQPRSQQPQPANDNQLPAPVPQGDTTSNHPQPPGTIDLLIKQHDAHRERLSQLATRPLPLHELQMLVCTELEQEHETLKAMGIMLHKELLKLRLEEGVMLNMLKLSEGGVLDVTDLEKIKARKPPSTRQLQAYDRMNERHYQKRLRTAKAARAAAIAMRAAMGIHTETTEGDGILYQDKPRVRKTRKRPPPARKRYETDDDNEGDQGEEGGEDQIEERADEVETDADAEPTRHRYQAPGESYSFRPATSSDQLEGRGAIGRPEASSAPAFVSLEEIKQLVVKRALKRTADDMMEQEADDEDLYELEFDEDEEQPGGEQRGQHDDDELDQHADMDMDVDSKYGGEIGDEGKEGEEEEEEEEGDDDEDEYYSSDEDGEGPGGDNEEDEDAARLALQRMLSIYGGGV